MRNSRCEKVIKAAALAIIGVLPAACETPVITIVVNSASYQPTLGEGASIATLFGTNLATTSAAAQTVPLPYLLRGTSVTVNGIAAPLFYVSPTQINFQTTGEGAIVVTTAAGSSAPYDPFTAIPGAWSAAGIFTMDASGCGQGAILNTAPDGSLSVNSTANSASPGQWIAVYASGTAEFYDSVLPMNVVFTSNPPATMGSQIGAEFDFGTPWAVAEWNGLAPGFVGLDQANFQIPDTAREGCAVPLQVLYAGRSAAITQPVTIAIRNGGGACVDPPAAGYGQILWQKTVTTSLQKQVSETDSMTASFQASPGKQAPAIPAGPPALSNVIWFGPSCPVPGYRSLGAGTVTAQAPGFNPQQAPVVPFEQPQPGSVLQFVSLEPAQLKGISVNQAPLPAGSIQGGNFTVAADGGTDVGAFQSSLHIGADIQVQTPLAGLTLFSTCAPLTIDWTGGDPKSWVTVAVVQQITSAYGGYELVEIPSQARASEGFVTLETGPYGCGVAAPHPGSIVVEVDPDPSEYGAFTAPGLLLGGLATWSYVHIFQVNLEIL